MLYRNERVFTKHDIEHFGDHVEEVAMRDFCDRLSSAMFKENRVEMIESSFHHHPDEKLYRAEVHVYHPQEMKKIRDTLREIFELKDVNAYDVHIRVKEIAELLGFAKKTRTN